MPCRNHRAAVVCACLASYAWTLGAGAQGAAEKRAPSWQELRYLISRYDDYAPVDLHSGAPRSIATEARLFDLFERYGATIAVGVVPFPIDEGRLTELDPARVSSGQSWLSEATNAWTILLRRYTESGTVEPALHGFEHRRYPGEPCRHGEFRKRPYDWQLTALRVGREALRSALDTPACVFIPPWNGWDANTARALATAGFDWLSPDLHHAEVPPGTVRVVPQGTADPAVARQRLEHGDSLPTGSILVLVIHPFDLEGPGGECYFRELEQLLGALRSSSSWASAGFRDLPNREIDVWTSRFRAAVSLHHWRRIALDSVSFDRPAAEADPVLYPLEWYDDRAWRPVRLVLVTMIGSIGVGFLAAWAVRLTPLRSSRRILWLALIATAGVLWLVYGALDIVLMGYQVRGIRWQAISLAAGLAAGLWTVRRVDARGDSGYRPRLMPSWPAHSKAACNGS